MLALQQRHEPLRTASRGEQGKVLQPIESVAVLPWQETDLDALALAQRLEKARRQAAQAAQPPLALQRAPLWRLAGDD